MSPLPETLTFLALEPLAMRHELETAQFCEKKMNNAAVRAAARSRRPRLGSYPSDHLLLVARESLFFRVMRYRIEECDGERQRRDGMAPGSIDKSFSDADIL